jgi:hypothetical protein
MTARYHQTYISYDSSNTAWACCGDYDCGDNPPSQRYFDAVTPDDWHAIGSGLSRNAIIGIGVGVGVAALAIIGGCVGFFFRRRRTSRKPAYGRVAKAQQYEGYRGEGQGDHQMQAPFVQGENQPYSRPHSPMPSQSYADRGVHQPPQ